MAKNIRTLFFIIIGIISIGLSIKCFSYEELDYTSKSIYGGDAFTGIQNASAQTSENIKDLAEIVQFGFGSVLLVSGLVLIGIGLTTPVTRQVHSEEGTEELPSNANEQIDPIKIESTSTNTSQITEDDKL